MEKGEGMTLMLVSYAKCGCRVSALLGGKDDPSWREFVSGEVVTEGHDVREEEHESIGALRCAQHPVGNDPT